MRTACLVIITVILLVMHGGQVHHKLLVYGDQMRRALAPAEPKKTCAERHPGNPEAQAFCRTL